MLSATRKAFCFFILSSITFGQTQAGLQYHNENTYRSTTGPLVIYDIPISEEWSGRLGGGLAFSSQDFEAITYASQINYKPLAWTNLSIRLSHRMNLPETFSRSSLLAAAQIKGSLLPSLQFFGLIGWYKRFVQLRQAQAIPTFSQISFTEHDLATEFGFSTAFSSHFEWVAKVATFDEVDTFNLNNPFIESTLIFIPNEGTSRWFATSRYQLLLGFGRLDRLTLLVGYQWGV